MRFLFLFYFLLPASALAAKDSASIPLDETMSAPAIDLIHEGRLIDRDHLSDWIRDGSVDSSLLDPQLSRLYRGGSLSAVEFPDLAFPPNDELSEGQVHFQDFLPGTSGLVRARVGGSRVSDPTFQMNLSLDTHAALTRNALLRKLGYAIPSPKYYSRMKVHFKSSVERDHFLDRLSNETLTSRNRWIAVSDSGSSTECSLVLQDLVLEPSLIEVPQLHWGILTPETLNSRRSLRALLIPLSILDIPENVNLFSFDAAKIFNGLLVFSRPGAEAFQNETSIGDARWIARKMGKLTRSDWEEIIAAGRYPRDIAALILEKTLARINNLMGLLSIKDFKPHPYNPRVTLGSVIEGKATQEHYSGFALRFTYGDPKSPLRASELARFLGVSALNGILSLALEKANTLLQLKTPEDHIGEYREKAYAEILNHLQNHPNSPYVQPVRIWGGPVGGANVNASRNIMTGTYYGSESQIQLVDTLSTSIDFGGFFGLSGIPRIGVAASPAIQASRNYVHVRPLPDLKTAWKDNWLNVVVPGFMIHLSRILAGEPDSSPSTGVKEFLDAMKPGEIFIITDSFLAAGGVTAQVPLGALIGFLPSFGALESSGSLGGSYGVLSRTTIQRTKDGLQVYLQRINSGTLELQLDSRFLIRIFEAAQNIYRGKGNTEAYVFPEKFDNEERAKIFQRDLRSLLTWNHPENLREDFEPFLLDHNARGHRLRLAFGPFSWVRRHHFHRVEIQPPLEDENDYLTANHKRTVIEGQLTRILGSDPWGFLGAAARTIEPLLNFSSSFKGDDPSSNFLGKSNAFSVNTQMEMTPGRSHEPFMRIERALTGWSLRKARLLRLIGKLSAQVAEHMPGSTLINPDEFTQTRKIHAYRLSWNLLIYPKGIARMIEVLNSEKTGTLLTQQILIKQMGQAAYQDYCESKGLLPVASRGRFTREDIPMKYGTVLETIQGEATYLGCATPFMLEIFALRSQFSSRNSVLHLPTTDEDRAKDKIRILNRVASRLSRVGDVGDLIGLVGRENSFFQARISGFRTKDENGDSEYFSNTIGLIDQSLLGGPLSDIATQSKISVNEIEARYLSNGY